MRRVNDWILAAVFLVLILGLVTAWPVLAQRSSAPVITDPPPVWFITPTHAPVPLAVWDDHEHTLTITDHFPGNALLCLTADDCRRPQDWYRAATRRPDGVEASR